MLNESIRTGPNGYINMATGPDNGPALLLLHGFTNRWQVFDAVLPALNNHWQVNAYDHSGHGKSARLDKPYSAATFYYDAEFALMQLRTPAVLLGHSMGGSLALHLAQNHPGRVRAVVTGDTSLNLAIHIGVMNNRRNSKLFGLRRRLAGRPVDELLRRGLSQAQADELSSLDPHVMDFHAESQVEGFFTGISDVDFTRLRCPLLITQANPEKGGLLQDEEITPPFTDNPLVQFKKFDTGHDLRIEEGTGSPFIQAALDFLNALPI